MEDTYFISIEGMDGSGKDTQLFALAKAIKEDSRVFGDKYSNLWITREPTNLSSAGNRISKLLKEGGFDGEEATRLYIEDRLEHTKLISMMLSHSHVITSRYDLSTLSYQMTQGMKFDDLYKRHKFGENDGCIEPDITIFFDLPADVAMSRIDSRGEGKEFFEKKEFMQKLRDNSLECVDRLKEKGRRVIVVDASKSMEEVTEEMIEKLKDL